MVDYLPERRDKMSQNSQQPAGLAQQEQMSAQQLERCFASLPDAVVVWDRAGKILSLNAAACTLFEIRADGSWLGTPSQQFLQRYTWWDEQQQPFCFAPWLLDLTALPEEAAARSYEQTVVLGLPSERRVVLELRCSAVLDAELQPIGMLSVFHEFTPRYQKALHLQRVYEALEIFNEAITRLPERFLVALTDETTLFSPPVLLVSEQLVDVIHEVLECWRVSLLALSSPPFRVSYTVGSGFTATQEHLRRAKVGRFLLVDLVDETVLARLQANQEVILTTDRLHVPTGYLSDWGTATLLMIPLLLGQHLAGVLVIHKQGWGSGYIQEEIDLVKAVAAQALLLINWLASLQKQMGKEARDLVMSEVDRLSKDFLTLASHGLRTPLTGIKGHVQLAQRRLERFNGSLPQQSTHLSEHLEETQRSLAAAERSIRLQERIIQEMIDDTSIQASQLDLSFRSCDLLAVIKAVVAKQQAFAPEHTVELENLASEPTIPIFADAERIAQVLTIYLTNALGYSPAGRPVTIQVTNRDTFVRVSVHDEGPSIPPEEQHRLWDRFYWGKRSAVHYELNLSLGLSFSLCRALIERHHGNVGVESEPSRGTTFWLSLPIRNLPDA
jgi:signal transduction histidine kinase